ncbi:eukaryotic translation initiation factor 3K [Actinidia rufa]|uniref:Eukaryotic translation initiation factor 3K n=1 Tax=Actinidia rufa TaxID=165716 RepID=A0A7J0FIQ3_9ERIC|nr:eukaryotic translation initiation factor 3K [Actinidia rufa]
MGEQFKTLIVLSHYLETARFRQFWDEAAKSRLIVEAINIEGLSLDKFLEHHVVNSGWILEKGQGKGQLIVLPRNEFNHPELKKSTADSIPLEHITRIFPILG